MVWFAILFTMRGFDFWFVCRFGFCLWTNVVCWLFVIASWCWLHKAWCCVRVCALLGCFWRFSVICYLGLLWCCIVASLSAGLIGLLLRLTATWFYSGW